MKNFAFWLCTWLFGASAISQPLTVDDLPQNIFGDYLDQNGRWSMDFNRDFLNGNNYPFGFFKTIEKNGDIYAIRVKKILDDQDEYSIKAKIGQGDTLWLADEIDGQKFTPYTRIEDEKTAFPEAENIIKGMRGEWYLTDGSDKKYIAFYDDHCIFNDESYSYNRYIKYGNTRQINISGPQFGRFIHLRRIKPDYITIMVLGENQQFLKRDPAMPNQESIAFNDVPETLLGKWHATNGSGFSLEMLPDYNVILNNNPLKMKRLTVVDNKISIRLNINGEEAGISLEPVGKNYCRMVFDGTSFYLKNSPRLPDGLVVENHFTGQWFACDGSASELIVEKDKFVNKKENVRARYNRFLDDGQQYKAFINSKPVLWVRKVDDNYVEAKFAPNGTYQMYKRKQELPDNAEIKLNKTLAQNWIDKTNGRWILSLKNDLAIYRNDFWNYGKITYGDGKYTINLHKTDTVCYYNQRGEYVCEFAPRSAQIYLTLQENLEAVINDGTDRVICVNHISKAKYRPDCELPINSKPGTAVVKGYIEGMPDATVLDFYVNDMLYLDQVNYNARTGNNGQFQINIPLATAQNVFIRTGNIVGSVFAAPGDTLMVFIGGNTRTLNENTLWMGEYADFNRDLAKYSFWRTNKNFQYQQRDEKNFHLEPEEYKATRKALHQEKLFHIQEFLSGNVVSNGFREWLFIEHEIDLNDDLMRYRWLRSMRNKKPRLESHPTYFDFTNSIDLTKQKYWTSNNFRNYLNELVMYFNLRFFSGETFFWNHVMENDNLLSKSEKIAVKKLIEKDILKGQDLLVEAQFRNREAINTWRKDRPTDQISMRDLWNFIKTVDTSLTTSQTKLIEAIINDADENGKIYTEIKEKYKEISQEIFQKGYIQATLDKLNTVPYGDFLSKVALSQRYCSAIKSGDLAAADLHRRFIENMGFNKEQLAHLDLPYEKLVDKLKKPLPEYCNLINAPEGSADELLANIANKHAGKVIYIDVWAPWCGPCRAEFAYIGPVKDALKDKNVAYVYLCGSGEKQAWENVIKQYNLQGDHYYLEPSTYSDLGAKFSITGIPRYMIMNGKGQVVKEEAPRPSNLQALLNELEKYLME